MMISSLTASKEMGTSDYDHKEQDSANKLNKLGQILPKGPRVSLADTLLSVL